MASRRVSFGSSTVMEGPTAGTAGARSSAAATRASSSSSTASLSVGPSSVRARAATAATPAGSAAAGSAPPRRAGSAATSTTTTATAATATSGKIGKRGPSSSAAAASRKREPATEDDGGAGSSSGAAAATRISRSRYDTHKVVDPFAAPSKKATPFQAAYNAGSIPARIQHTSSSMYLTWDVPLVDLDYSQLLVTVCDGLRETKHPYVTMARLAWKDMMGATAAEEKVTPLLNKLVGPLRVSLLGADQETFLSALDAIQSLSRAVGPSLNEHLVQIVGQISKKAFDKKLKPKIEETLQCLEEHGGPEACPIIKSKVPTYTSVFM